MIINIYSLLRYDGRGHLYNLNEYEAKPGGGLAADDLERHEEELCEEERWRSLYHDDSEDVIKEEEEQKRSQEASGAQFNFNYDNDSGKDFLLVIVNIRIQWSLFIRVLALESIILF